MDDYAQYVYQRNPEKWDKIEVGDVSYMKSIKKKLQCKPFSYFLNNVASDMLDRYPPVEPPAFASGTVRIIQI
jgi:polypeptide N-acetylgalactosaminyltransferase